MKTESKAWRGLRARMAASAAGHLKILQNQTSELKRRDEKLRKLIAEAERSDPKLFSRRQRKAARKNAIADEHRQRASRKPASSVESRIREINETNRKYAKGMAAPFERRASKNPSLLLTEAGFARLQAEAMAVFEERSAAGSSNAQKPRRKKGYRQLIIAEMYEWHRRRRTLDEFLGGSEDSLGGRNGFSIKPVNSRNANEFIIECDEADDPEKPISLNTIRGWWTEAGKKSKTG
jgi:hypothetical protein